MGQFSSADNKESTQSPLTETIDNKEFAINSSQTENISPQKLNPKKEFGLYSSYTEDFIPLKLVDINVQIMNSIAEITQTQEYFNPTDKNLEITYYFPKNNSDVLVSLQAHFEDMIIEGVIKSREEAQIEYETGVATGQMMVMAQTKEEPNSISSGSDIIKVKIGNLPPSETVKIVFSYVSELQISMNKFWKLLIPSTLTPRYQSSASQLRAIEKAIEIEQNTGKHQDYINFLKENLNDMNLQGLNVSQEEKLNYIYQWKINVQINANSPITFLKSSSHDIIVKYTNGNTIATISFKSGVKEYPNKDFSLYYQDQQINKPQLLVGKTQTLSNKTVYAGLLCFIPKLEDMQNDEAFQELQSSSDPLAIHLNKKKGEFIFLLDRSGSMYGKRIQMAKQALMYFLKSLPEDSYFNIISFGSKYKVFNPKQSIRSSDESLEKALTTIQSYNADLGGTKLYDPLFVAYSLLPFQGYKKTIFLLTDGDIFDQNDVFNIISAHIKMARVYSIGIGNGCSTTLIEESAKRGLGKYEFVADTEDLNEKVVSLLSHSLLPIYEKVKISYDQSLVEHIFPDPSQLKWIAKNEALKFQIIFNQNAFQNSKKMQFNFAVKEQDQKYDLPIDISLNQVIECSTINKLVISNLINKIMNSDQKRAIELSIDNQVMQK